MEQDELEEYDPEDSLLLDIHSRLSSDQADAQPEGLSTDGGLSQDESFAFLAPYIKLEADPEEFYLCLLKGTEALSGEEADRLEELREERARRVESLPDHAWIIVPAFPDIIKEYLVLYALKTRDIVPLTKLARANSVYGLGHFLTRAIEDWPEEPLFQRMLATPPENILEYFEFYIPWLAAAREIKNLKPVEDILLQGRATLLFARYEMELWCRLAIVLTEREDWDRLLDSAGHFVQYVSETYDHPKVQERAVEVLNGYAVGLHNAAEAEKLASFLDKCDQLAKVHPDDQQLALFCCDNRGNLIHLWRYLEHTDPVEQEWSVIAGYLTSYPQDRDICLSAIRAADEYYICLRRSGEDTYQHTKDLAELLETVFENHPILEAADLFAVVTANLYMLTLDKTQEHSEELFQILQGIFAQFSASKRIRSAYASVCGKKYVAKETQTHDVPRKVMERLKKWNIQYPDEIEFKEALFDVTLAHLGYAQEHGRHKEALHSFRELERIAQTANYEEYHEENHLKKRVELLRELFEY